MTRIRLATPADAPAIGEMHARSWAETYHGVAPPDLVAEMSDPARRRTAWARNLAEPLLPDGTLLAEEGEEVVGFVSVCAAREVELGAEGEVAGLYLLRRAQRRGIGTALLRRGAARLAKEGHRSAGAWALDANAPASAFYAATGAVRGASRVEHRGRDALPETAWIWRDTTLLLP
jgi:GNAT superfamily N-acetyltransferase